MAIHASNGARTPRRQPRSTDATPARPKELPNDIGAEASILGGILLRNELVHELDLETEDFFALKHQVVWSAMLKLAHDDGQPIDIQTLESEIAREGRLEAIGDVAFLGQLALRVPTPDNVLAYASTVKEKRRARDLMLAASEIIEAGYQNGIEVSEYVEESLAKLSRLAERDREHGAQIPFITIHDSLAELEQLSKTPTYETPFHDLNRILGFGGLLSGQVYYLTGATGFGKTSFLAQLVKHHAERDQLAIVAFYEMFAGYYTARMAAGVLGVHSNEILRWNVAAHDILRALPRQIKFLDSPSLSLLKRGVEMETRRTKTPPLVVIDYIQLLGDKVMATMARPDPRVANAQASATIRALAKDTGAAVLVVSAAGRSASKRLSQDVRKMPARELVDASRESGAIEYDGAGVIVLSVSDEKDGDESVATISVAKARFGETYHIDARYDGARGSWREIGRVSVVPKATKEAPSESATSNLRTAITRVLKHGPVKTKNGIHRLTGKSKPLILAEVDAMIDAGLIAIRSDGYTLCDPGITTAAETPNEPVSPAQEPLL